MKYHNCTLHLQPYNSIHPFSNHSQYSHSTTVLSDPSLSALSTTACSFAGSPSSGWRALQLHSCAFQRAMVWPEVLWRVSLCEK